MNLIKDLIEKRLEKKEFYELRRFYVRALWEHLQVYSLAVVVLEIHLTKKEIRKRNNLYKTLRLKGTVNEKDTQKISKIFNSDFDLINKAVEKLNKINDELSVSYGSYYVPGRVAVDMDEFPIG